MFAALSGVTAAVEEDVDEGAALDVEEDVTELVLALDVDEEEVDVLELDQDVVEVLELLGVQVVVGACHVVVGGGVHAEEVVVGGGGFGFGLAPTTVQLT